MDENQEIELLTNFFDEKKVAPMVLRWQQMPEGDFRINKVCRRQINLL
jgi:hypothetical protein